MRTKDFNILVVYSCKNSKGKHDATGAFIPEARAFAALHGVPENNMCAVDCRRPVKARRTQVLEAIAAVGRNQKIDMIAFFCHGWPSGIQVGIRRAEIPQLVDRLKHFAAKDLKIALYACLTAENDVRDQERERIGPATKWGFADTTSYLLGKEGFHGWIDAHKTSGHTTWNPYVVRFMMQDSSPRAAWLVEPGSQMWGPWVKAVRGTNVRFEFPFWTEIDLKTDLWVGE
jgi:hypothetical protein